MTNIFAKWNNTVDVEGLKKDFENAQNNTGSTSDRVEVPLGTYEVAVTKLELKESKKGDPMVSIWFKVLAGEYKDQIIFYNKLMTKGFWIHQNVELVRSFETGVNVDFEGFEQFHNTLGDVLNAINDQNLEYALEYTKNNKGFEEYRITEVFQG